MEDRIAALEEKQALLLRAIETCNIRRIALHNAFVGACGPLLALAGLSPDQVKFAGDTMSSEVLFLTIDGAGAIDSDRITSLLSEELDSIMGKLAEEVAALDRVPLPAARNRFEAMATAISASGCHLADAQRQKLAVTLQSETAAAAIAECESFRNLCEHNADCETEPAIKAALLQISLYARMRIVALRSSLPTG